MWLFHSRIVIFISGPLLVFVAAFTSARRPTVVQKSSKTVWGYLSSARHRRHTCTRVVGRLLVSGRVNANGQGGATCPRDGSHRGVRQGGFTWGAPQGVMKFNFVVFIDSVGSRRYMPLHLFARRNFRLKCCTRFMFSASVLLRSRVAGLTTLCYLDNMADRRMRGNTEKLGVNTHQVYTFHLDAGNALGVAAGPYKFGISGYLAAQSNDVIESEQIGLIFKVNGHCAVPCHEDIGWREGRHEDSGWQEKGWQPAFCNFPVMHAKYHLGTEEACQAMKACFENGDAVMFTDTRGSHRAIIAAALMIGLATGVAATHWLRVIAERRNVPWIFEEILREYVDNGSPRSYCPDKWTDYISFCRLIGRRAMLKDHNLLMHRTATPPPLGTPRSGQALFQAYENRFAAREDASFEAVTPVPPRESPEMERGILPTELVDPALEMDGYEGTLAAAFSEGRLEAP